MTRTMEMDAIGPETGKRHLPCLALVIYLSPPGYTYYITEYLVFTGQVLATYSPHIFALRKRAGTNYSMLALVNRSVRPKYEIRTTQYLWWQRAGHHPTIHGAFGKEDREKQHVREYILLRCFIRYMMCTSLPATHTHTTHARERFNFAPSP